MHHDKVQFQAAVFGNFSTVQPNADTIKAFMDGFADLKLIPSVLETPEARSPAGITFRIGPDIRFLFRSEDGRWTVSFQNERVDILTVKADPKGEDLTSEKEFIDKAVDLLKTIRERVPVKYKRLSFVTKHFSLAATEEELV